MDLRRERVATNPAGVSDMSGPRAAVAVAAVTLDTASSSDTC